MLDPTHFRRATAILAACLLCAAASVLPAEARQAKEAPVPDTTQASPPATIQRPERYVLDPIEATATRERATAPPVATITVDPQVVRTIQNENPYDLVRRVAGLEVHDQGQGPGFSSNVVLRGFTADHSSDVLLVVDGVQINYPIHGHIEGYADWTSIFQGAVSSLRVIHGPSSALHGDFSIGGAVELYTLADADGVEGSFSGNRYGDLSGWITAGRRGERGGGLVGLDLRRYEGWRENSDRRIGNALLRGWRSVGDGRIEGGLALHAADWNSPGFVSLQQFQNRDLDRFADRTDGGQQARAIAHGRYAASLGNNRYLQVMGWGLASDMEFYLTTPGHVDATGNLYQTGEFDRRWGAGGQVEYSWIPSWGEITIGTSVRTDAAAYDRDETLRRRMIAEEVAIDARHTAFAAYARWRKTLWNRLGLDLGGRIDHLRFRSLNRLGLEEASGSSTLVFDELPYPIAFHVVGPQGPVGEWVSGTTTVVSPKLGARYYLTDAWSLMASTSRGFRSAPGVLGDPVRPPLLAWAHEVGVGYDALGASGHVSYFRTHVSNERIQDPITRVITSAGTSVRQGLDGNVRVELPAGITLYARGTYTDARLSGSYADAHHDHGVDEGELEPEQDDGEGERVPGVARYFGQVSATASLWRNLEARVEVGVTGPYVPIGEPDVTTDPFAVMDFGVRFPMRDAWLLDLEVRNVLDRVYAEARSSGYINPGTPRNLGITVHYTGFGR